MFLQLQRKYFKERKLLRKIEIFGDNRKILVEELRNDKNEIMFIILFLLDSKFFSDIDCDDFLNLTNRLDGFLSILVVLDYKLYWLIKIN